MVDNPYKIQTGKRILMDIVSSVSYAVLILIIYSIGFLYSISSNTDFSKAILTTLPIVSILSIVFLFLFVGIGFKVLYKLIYYSTLSYSIEKDHIIFRGGIISRFERSLPYSKMQHAIIYRTLWQRIFGLSSLSIVTAREGGMNPGYNRNNQNTNFAMMNGVYIPDINKEDAIKLRDHIISNANKFKSIAGV